jgi:hypothetical protein
MFKGENKYWRTFAIVVFTHSFCMIVNCVYVLLQKFGILN